MKRCQGATLTGLAIGEVIQCRCRGIYQYKEFWFCKRHYDSIIKPTLRNYQNKQLLGIPKLHVPIIANKKLKMLQPEGMKKFPGFQIELPYDTNFSKNRMYKTTIKKQTIHKYLNPEYKALLELTAYKAHNCIGDLTIQPCKLWIDIFVYRPNMKADVINFIDGIADGLKTVLCDDRWFSVKCDWAIDTINPRIIIKVYE